MKKMILGMFKTAAVLTLMFVVLLSATASVPIASTVTVGMAAMSAIYHVSAFYSERNYALTAPVVPAFTVKTQVEKDAMDSDAYDKYVTEERDYNKAVMSLEVYNQIEAYKTADATKNAGVIADLTKKFETIATEHVGAQLAWKQFKEQSSKGFRQEENAVHKWITENAGKIKELRTAGSGFIELKVVGPMEIASASLPVAAPNLVGVQQAPPTSINLRGTIAEGLVTTIPTSLAQLAYTETVPKDGNYGFVAEKGTKPQIDFKIETRYASPYKVAAHMVLTDESVNDIPNLQAIATNFLKKKHDIKKENGILFGTGASAEIPKGATVYARAFSAGPLANTVATPNMMDVINACITDIYTTHNYTDETPYFANVAMMHPVDFFSEFVAAKDANGLPLYPMATLFNRVVIGGVTIIPFEDITAGKIFVADLSKYNISRWEGYTVKIGWINDQLITNQFTMVGESRFHAFVKKLDEQAFIYDTIATVKAAIAST